MIPEFPHNPPNGYYYQFSKFNTRLISIWLCHKCTYDYNLGKPVKTIWGFYSPKKKEYYAPINSLKVGEKVDISKTRSYTAIQLKVTPLEAAFL